jgi:hypothetical protein
MIRDSTAHEIVQFNAEPAIVAQACIEVLNSMGKVKNVSRETGIISGQLTRRPNAMANPVIITIRITRKGNQTEVSINTSRKEGMITSDGALKGLAAFLQELGQNPKLAGNTSAGW